MMSLKYDASERRYETEKRHRANLKQAILSSFNYVLLNFCRHSANAYYVFPVPLLTARVELFWENAAIFPV